MKRPQRFRATWMTKMWSLRTKSFLLSCQNSLSQLQVETVIDEVVDDAVNAILEEEDAAGTEKVVMELKELEEKVVGAAVATLKEEGGNARIRLNRNTT